MYLSVYSFTIIEWSSRTLQAVRNSSSSYPQLVLSGASPTTWNENECVSQSHDQNLEEIHFSFFCLNYGKFFVCRVSELEHVHEIHANMLVSSVLTSSNVCTLVNKMSNSNSVKNFNLGVIIMIYQYDINKPKGKESNLL